MPILLHFIVQRVAKGAIKLVCVGGAKHHAKILAVDPVALLPKLLLHALMKHRSRKRVRHRDADIVRSAPADQSDRLFDLRQRLARIAKLEKERRANAGSAKPLPRASRWRRQLVLCPSRREWPAIRTLLPSIPLRIPLS